MPATFVVLDRLPRTAGGKINRRDLPAPAASDLTTAAFVEPNTETERAIAGTWRQLLGVAGIGLDDNFFDLGGHSLLAARFISSIRHDFGVEVAMRAVFENPTVREFAAWFDLYRASVLAAASDEVGEELFL